jgi:DNA-binding LacI/PurR family transcriptional regulator
LGIREVARHLNVSISTVSRALSGHPEVSEETRQRVQEAAKALGYEPDQAGRSLRQGSINAIAFVLSTDRTTKTDAGFFMELSRGVQDVLARHGLDLVLHLTWPGDDMTARMRRIVERRQADALILAETREEDPRLDYLVTRGFPFVTIGRSHSGGAHPWLDLDFDSAMAQILDRLVGFGHRRIVLVTGEPGMMLDNILRAAYRRQMAARGLSFDPALMCSAEPDEAGGFSAIARILALPDRPTAIIFPHHRAVAGAYSQLREAGLTPGRDIAIVACSADTPTAQFMVPSLTCFNLDLYGLGCRLAEALLASIPRFADEYGGGLVQEVWPWRLVPRASDDFAMR